MIFILIFIKIILGPILQVAQGPQNCVDGPAFEIETASLLLLACMTEC
jgi:hypothetical protein